MTTGSICPRTSPIDRGNQAAPLPSGAASRRPSCCSWPPRRWPASQRGPEIRRLHLKRIEEIGVTACDNSCPPSDDILGTAMPDEGVTPGTVDCAVVLNMPLIQRTSRDWRAPVSEVTASVLVHEQEHCLRVPDDRETPAVAAELRLARSLRNPRLGAFVKASMERLDASGYWRP